MSDDDKVIEVKIDEVLPPDGKTAVDEIMERLGKKYVVRAEKDIMEAMFFDCDTKNRKGPLPKRLTT